MMKGPPEAKLLNYDSNSEEEKDSKLLEAPKSPMNVPSRPKGHADAHSSWEPRPLNRRFNAFGSGAGRSSTPKGGGGSVDTEKKHATITYTGSDFDQLLGQEEPMEVDQSEEDTAVMTVIQKPPGLNEEKIREKIVKLEERH